MIIPKLPQIIKLYGLLKDGDLTALEKINGEGSDKKFTTQAPLKALREAKDVHNPVYSILADNIANVAANAKKHVAVPYLEKAFDTNKSDAINVAAIKAYPVASVANLSDKPLIIQFIIDKWAQFDATKDHPKLKKLIKAYLKNKENQPSATFEKAFEKIYPGKRGITKDTGAEVYGKYMKSGTAVTELMDTEIEQILPPGSPEEVAFLNACFDVANITQLGAISTADHKAIAKKILKICKRSTHPQAKIFAQQIVDALPSITETPDKKTARARALYVIAINPNADPAKRIAAFKALLPPAGIFRRETLVSGTSIVDSHEALKKHYASLLYSEKQYGMSNNLIAKLKPKQRKKFCEIYKKAAVNENDMNYMLTDANTKAIGAEALNKLAMHATKTTDSQKVRIWKKIGMMGLAREKVNSITDSAERAFLKALLVSRQSYAQLVAAARTKPEARKKLKKIDKLLSKAYFRLNRNHPDRLQIGLAEQIFKFSQSYGKIDSAREVELLAMLKIPSVRIGPVTFPHNPLAHLTGAGQTVTPPPTPPATLTAAQKLSNSIILRAKAIIAQREIALLKFRATSLSRFAGLASSKKDAVKGTADYLKDQLTANPKYKLTATDGAMLKTLFAKVGDNPSATFRTDPATRKIYSVLLVKMALKTNDKKYIQKVKPADLAGDDRADYHVAMAKFNPSQAVDHLIQALSYRSNWAKGVKHGKEAIRLAGSNKAKKIKIADKLASFNNRKYEKLALKTYNETQSWVKMFNLLSKASSASSLTIANKISGINMLKNSSRPDLGIKVAASINRFDLALNILKAKATNISLQAVKDGIAATTNGFTAIAFTKVIAEGGRKIEPPAGRTTAKTAQFNSMYGASPKIDIMTAYGSTKRDNIRKAFNII